MLTQVSWRLTVVPHPRVASMVRSDSILFSLSIWLTLHRRHSSGVLADLWGTLQGCHCMHLPLCRILRPIDGTRQLDLSSGAFPPPSPWKGRGFVHFCQLDFQLRTQLLCVSTLGNPGWPSCLAIQFTNIRFSDHQPSSIFNGR